MKPQNILLNVCLLLLTLIGVCSCDENTEGIGVSLTEQADNMEISTAVFPLTSRSVASGPVWSRSVTGSLGRVKDPETGGYITSHFMTQFHTLEGFTLPEKSTITSLDDDGEIKCDSCDIRLFFLSFYGDSLAVMKVRAYEMDKPMLESQKYYSSFDPKANGYVRSGGLVIDHSYTLHNDEERADKENSTKDNPYINNICIRLNQPYTDKNGVTYNNFGTFLLRKYFADPSLFSNSMRLMKELLPGFYFEITGGMGAMAYITATQLTLYYTGTGSDGTTTRFTTLFSGTEEVLQTNYIELDESNMSALLADHSCTYLKSPAGIFTELTLPVDEIMSGHEKDTLSTASIAIQRINSLSPSDYTLPPSANLLMIESDSVTQFFEQSKLPDSKRTYVSAFSSTNNNYEFNNIGSLISSMYQAKKEGLAHDPNWLSTHPNWNKVWLIPVTTSYVTLTDSYGRTTRKQTNLTHNMALTSVRLQGGDTPLSMRVIYSKFK